MHLASCATTRSNVSNRSNATELTIGRPMLPLYASSPARMMSVLDESMHGGNVDTDWKCPTSQRIASTCSGSRCEISSTFRSR